MCAIVLLNVNMLIGEGIELCVRKNNNQRGPTFSVNNNKKRKPKQDLERERERRGGARHEERSRQRQWVERKQVEAWLVV